MGYVPCYKCRNDNCPRGRTDKQNYSYTFCDCYIAPKQTNAGKLREKLLDDKELAKSRIRRDGIFFKALDAPNMLFEEVEDAISEELDWLKQEVTP